MAQSGEAAKRGPAAPVAGIDHHNEITPMKPGTAQPSFAAWRIFLSLCLLALLAGCAVTPEQRASREPQAVNLRANEGIVLLKVASNRNVDTFFAKWQTLQIRDASSGETYTLSDRSPPHAAYSQYVGSVPPGKYTLEKFDNQAHGAIVITVRAGLGAQYGRFEVAAGRVTDLGSLVFLRNYYPVDSSTYRVAFTRVAAESAHALAGLDPAIAKAADQGVLGWLPESANEQRMALDKTKEAPSLFLNDPKLGDDGSLLVGEALGHIGKRAADGRWSWLDTGTINTILALQTFADGSLLAGSEQSQLLRWTPGSGQWQALPLPLQDASIRFLAAHPARGQLLVAQDRRHIIVLATASLDRPQWKELYRVPLELFTNPLMDTRMQAFLAGDKLYIAALSAQFTPKADFHVLDLKAGTWSHRPIDLYSGAYGGLPDGSVFSMSGPNISQAFRVSHDDGQTWEKRESPNWAGQPVFRDERNGYFVRIEEIAMFDAEKNTNSVWKTGDAGRSWQKLGASPNLSARLIPLARPGQLLLVTYNGKLYRSDDDGANWVLERQLPR